jgi:hypothetical protein
MLELATPILDVPDDPALPGLTDHAQPDGMLRVCREALEPMTNGASAIWERCIPTEAVYQPGRSCRIAYQLYRERWIRPEIVYARWSRTDHLHASAVRAGPPDAPFELYKFPSDRRMPQIGSMHEPCWLRDASESWVRQWLGDGRWADEGWRCTPIRYVPESRLACQLKGRWVGEDLERCVRAYVRMARQNHVEEQSSRLRMLQARAATLGFDVPHVLGDVPHRHLLATELIRGTTLWDAGDGEGPNVIRNVSGTLAAIRRAAVDGCAARDSAVTPETMLEELSAAVPGLAGLCEELRGWSWDAPPNPGPGEWVHGNLHSGQVLLSNDRVWVVDWERAGLGDPTQDITNLAVEFESRELAADAHSSLGSAWAEACVEGWRAAGGTFHASSAPWWAARAYVLRAWGLMRRLRPGWSRLVGLSLQRAANVYRFGCGWIT